jgi:predicted DCC family thiol-disulfide oxidoreductase YuxK
MSENNQGTSDALPPIVFFDGVCGLCNSFVDLLLRVDSKGALRFAPLQGETARGRFGPQAESPKTILLEVDGKILEKSDAAIESLAILGGIGRLSRILYLFPRIVRNSAYDFIAARRYRLFGKRESCRLPTPSEKERFLP